MKRMNQGFVSAKTNCGLKAVVHGGVTRASKLHRACAKNNPKSNCRWTSA